MQMYISDLEWVSMTKFRLHVAMDAIARCLPFFVVMISIERDLGRTEKAERTPETSENKIGARANFAA